MIHLTMTQILLFNRPQTAYKKKNDRRILPRSPCCLLLLLFVNVLVDGQLMDGQLMEEDRLNGERSNFVVWH